MGQLVFTIEQTTDTSIQQHAKHRGIRILKPPVYSDLFVPFMEREIHNFRGYGYKLRDQDITCPAAYESVRRGYDKKGVINYSRFSSMVSKVRCLAWYITWWALLLFVLAVGSVSCWMWVHLNCGRL